MDIKDSNKFAKIFGDNENQILILFHRDEEGKKPEIQVKTTLEEFGVCTFAFNFADTDDGWRQAKTYFHDMDEDEAHRLAIYISKLANEHGTEDNKIANNKKQKPH